MSDIVLRYSWCFVYSSSKNSVIERSYEMKSHVHSLNKAHMSEIFTVMAPMFCYF